MTAAQGSRGGKRSAAPPRDQQESAFTSILASLVATAAGVHAAALVDREGETVDYAGATDAFGLRVMAAHWRIVLFEAERQGSLQDLRWLVVRATRRSYLLYALPEGYALVVELSRAAGFIGWHRAVATCARALGEEAGWCPTAVAGAQWFSVQVTCDERGRPCSVRVKDRAHAVEVLGALVRATFREVRVMSRADRAWRVRVDTGVEAMLVREPGGAWYADEPFDRAERPRRPLTSRRR